MRRSPFAAVILAGSLALQLLLAAGGATCLDPDHGSAQRSAGADRHSMAGMDVTMNMAGHDMGTPAEPQARHDSPCEERATPADCQVMAPCAGGFFASTFAHLDANERMPSRVAPRPTLALSSRTVPPELPPPRA